jgi:hypothetical protein
MQLQFVPASNQQGSPPGRPPYLDRARYEVDTSWAATEGQTLPTNIKMPAV